MNYVQLSSEFVRSLRGNRSQTAFSRRLGYRSNVVYPWESGRRFPTAAEAMRAARISGIDLDAVWSQFYSTPPNWLRRVDAASPRGLAWLLSDLRGRTPIGDIARSSGYSRYAVSRWLNGQTEPRLPQFFALFNALSLRLLDLLDAMLDIDSLPSARAAWSQLEAQRRAAFEMPWTQAILMLLETEDYRELARHRPGWISERLELPEGEEQACLEALAQAGQIEFDQTHWRLAAVLNVDTRGTPAHGLKMKQFWARQGLERLARDQQGLYSYNVFGVSEADLSRLRKLHLAYFRQLRSIVAESTPTERVAVVNLQLFELD